MRFRLHSSKKRSKQCDKKLHKKYYDVSYKHVGERYIKIKEWHDNDGIPLMSPEATKKIDETLSPKEKKKAEKLLINIL